MPVSASPIPGRSVTAAFRLPALLAVLLAAGGAWFFFSYVPRERAAAFETWSRDLVLRAEIRQEALQRYFAEALADAETFGSYPAALQTLAMGSAAAGSPVAGVEGPAAHLEEHFDNYVRIHGILGVVLWNAGGKPAVKSRVIVLEAGCASPAREVLASGLPAVGFHSHESIGPVLTFAAPVRSKAGRALGAIVVAVDPRAWLYPLLSQPLAGTSSGETLVVARDGADALYLTPLRFRSDAPLTFRRPLDTPGFTARAALDGNESVGSYIDYRGVRVFSAGRRLPPTPWALLVKVDEDEALAAFRGRMRRTAFSGTATLIAVLGVAWGLTQRRELVHAAAIARSDERIRQLNRLLRTISEINQAIVHIDDRMTLLPEACRILVEHGGFRMAWIGFVDPTSSRVVPAARTGDGISYLDGIEIRTDDMPEGRGPVGTAIRTGRRVVIPDLAAEPTVAPWRERMLEHGFRTAGVFPFLVRGEVTGALTVYGGDPFAIGDEETTLLEELAGDIGYALEAMEDRAERRRAEEALRDSEERFRLAAETAADVIYEWDIGTNVQWFGNVDELMGHAPGEFPRTLEGWAQLIHPDDREHVMAAVDRQLKGEAPYDVEYRVRKKDGVYAHWWARGTVLRDAAGKPCRWIGSITDITERKRAEGALRESESRFRQLAESLPQLVWTCQPDGPCDYLNRQWIEFTGVPEAQQIGFGWLEQLHPDDRAPTIAAWEAAVASGGNFRAEFRIRRHDGEYRWFDTQAVRLLDAEGHTVKLYGSNTDITEHKRAETVLRESEARLRTLLENIPQKIFMKSRTFRYVSVNENYARDFGIRPEDVVGMVDYDLFPKEHADKYRADDVRVMETAQTEEFEERYLQGGLEKWIHTIKTPVRDRGGEIIGVLGVFRDITERKRADAALRASETRFRSLFEGMLGGFAHCEMVYEDGVPTDFVYLDVNQAFGRLTGLKDVVGKRVTEVIPGIRESNPVLLEVYGRVASTGEPAVFEDYIPALKIWFAISAYSPRKGYFVAVFDNISERKRAEEEVRTLNEKLEERVKDRTRELEAANREMEAFSYSVSHDLRAPLRAIDGFSRILLEDYAEQLDAEGKRLLGVVRANTRQMGNLIDDLLSFSRIGRQEMARKDVDMEALARAAFRELGAASEEVSFTVGPLPRADADPSLMRQVFMNLISNALKFTGPKAQRTVEVGERTEPDRIVYWVKDNGVGFDMAYADKLFGVFQRLHAADEFEGTGVGLALVQHIVHRHGGEVWAEGKVGEGATFSFSLPRPGGS